MYEKSFIPFRGYFSSPFSRWQGSLQLDHPLELACATVRAWLPKKGFSAKMFDYVYVGATVGQKHNFFYGPWASALIGATEIPGLYVSQACSTSTTCINLSAVGVETGMHKVVLALMADRTSNGPHTIWPNPLGPGAEVIHENWIMDNFNYEPIGQQPMVQTAENVAKKVKGGVTKEFADAVTLRRYEQYLDSLKDDRAFQKKYMIPVQFTKNKKEKGVLEADEGIMPTTKEGLAGLKPQIPGGVHSFGAQTHPADGHSAVIITTKEKAKELSADPGITIQLLSYGYARAEKAHMGMAPAPAARMAIEKAGISAKDLKAIKTHNPFVANDIYLASDLGIDVMGFDNYGSSIIYGHPQAPTGGRLVMELIEEVVMLGGGYGLFTGCAAGDTGAALVVKVSG
jgi:acetyl-CoA acetyltransferase